MGEVIQFPSGEAMVPGKKCKTCGFVMVLTRWERESGGTERDECFCCQRNLKLPLSSTQCPDCDGTGRQAVHRCMDERDCKNKRETCPKHEECMACLGTGRR